MIKNLTYYLIYGVAYALSLLPFRVLYAISDVFFLLVYHVVRYRRKVVRKNLTSSFPEMSIADIRQTERQFYHWFCDYGVETLKLLTISGEKLLRHFELRGVEQVEKCFDEGQDCAAILGHYCNWEWLSATGMVLHRHPQAVMGLIYHPLRNDVMDRLFINIRSAHDGVCIQKKLILRYLVEYQREQRRTFFGYISDQTPRWQNIHLWLPFLNHNTPVFTGGERIMRKMKNAVFYASMERPRRGQYVCTFRLITREPQKLPDNEVTVRFFQLLEADIRRQPAFYLWTHNRWKRTHEEYERRQREGVAQHRQHDM